MNTYPFLLRCALVSAAFLCIGCGEDEEVLGPLPECTGAVTVSVSTGSTVVFGWSPKCKLFFLLVEPVGSGHDLWSTISDSTNAIAPPVTYGVVPNGAKSWLAAEDLVPGQAYNVYVYRWTGPGRQDGELAGSAQFVR